MNPATYISMSTVRLLCGSNGVSVSVGTGFFYLVEIDTPEGKGNFPLIFTNKHVVNGHNEIRITVTTRSSSGDVSELVVAPGDVHRTFLIPNCQQRIVFHPDAGVDLCAFYVGDVFEAVQNSGLFIRNTFLHKNFLVPHGERKNVRAIEPIMMIGYPNGLWDEHNNRPLARRGSTASHPFLKWNGRQEFVIDAACFPGSSGSPVFLFEDIMFRTKDNSYTPGTRAQLLGVLASGPLFTNEGTLVQRDIPTATAIVPVVPSMMNLGNVVHADALQKVIDLASVASVEGRTFARAISV